jgi:hypothetical protein
MLEKSRKIRKGCEAVLIMGALALAFGLAAPRAALAQNLGIFAVNHLDFGDTNEVTATPTNTTADPVNFYNNTAVVMTSAIDVVLVTSQTPLLGSAALRLVY